MQANYINKNLTVYNIKKVKATYDLIIIITLTLGWLLFPIKLNNNKQLNTVLFGYNRLYKFFFKLKGFGYKWKYRLMFNKQKEIIYLKLGFTHRLALIVKTNSKYKLKRRRFTLKSRSYCYIRTHLNPLFFLYQKYLYNKKGIYIRGTQYKLKISKKKAKF